jgi:lysine-specific demethylase 8
VRGFDIPARAVLPIAKIDPPDADTFERRYARQSLPVVIRGAANHWPACGAWSPERLVSLCGDNLVLVTRYEGGSARDVSQVRMTVKAFIEAVCRREAGSEHLAWNGEDATTTLPQVVGELRLPDLVRTECSQTAIFMAGPRTWPYRSASNQFHYHPGVHAFATQIVGRKLFRLYGPRETRHLRPPRFWTAKPSRSTIEVHRADPAALAALRRARCFETVLEQGDALFIPASWWHLVGNEEFAILATTFYPAPVTQWRLGTVPGLATVIDRIRRRAVWRYYRKAGHIGLRPPAGGERERHG